MPVVLRRGDATRFLRLSAGDKLRWTEALAAVSLTRACLRVTSLQRLARGFGLTVCSEPSSAHSSSQIEALQVATRIRAVLRRWPARSPCLVAALAGGLLLRRHSPKLFIGVRRNAGSIVAHAWLDVASGRVPLTLPDDVALEFVALRRARVA